MKKSVAMALAAAFVVSASSTTFAAANPFSDVPENHWAYKSIAKLADAGIIEGYGDGTYRGERKITRYEMAQMIAKAMANIDKFQENAQVDSTGSKLGLDGKALADLKAELDRLAADFRDDLDALGVRVSNLEKYADKVTWTGELRYRYWNNRETLPYTSRKLKRTTNNIQFRLFPTAEVNDHWKLKARMTASMNPDKDTTGDFKLTYGYAEGTYGKFQIKLGKQELWSDVDQGLVVDDFFSGAQVSYGDKFKVLVEAGRWNLDNADADFADLADNVASYQGIELSYDAQPFYIGAAFRHFRSDSFKEFLGYSDKKKNASIWSVGARYTFGDAVTLQGAFARNSKAQYYKKAYNIELSYKGANREKGSWGAGVAYRYVGQNVGLAPTYDTYWDDRANKKGFEIYANWAPFKNSLTELRYFTGKTLDTEKKTRTFFGRVSFFF